MWTFSLALAAPLDAAAVDALLARDGLLRPPLEGTCCGEGAVTLQQVRWAELDGTPPEELIVTLLEYVGEGCATDHHHVYDVSGAAPTLIGTLTDGGYVVFPYLELTDLDRDGQFELLAVGPSAGEDPSTLALHRLVEGALVQQGAFPSVGEVYLPFDVDQDGLLEVVALARGDDDVRVEAPGRDARPAESPALATWLPSLFEQALASDSLRRADTALELLASAMVARNLQPPHPEVAFASVVEHVATGSNPGPYVASTWWAGTPADRARLVALLDDPARAQAAARLLLRTPGDRTPVLDWIGEQVRSTLAGEGTLPYDTVLRPLQAHERAVVCALIEPLLLGDGAEKPRGDLSFWALPGPLFCTDATVAVLAATDLPEQVVRGAIASVERAQDNPEAKARLEAHNPAVAKSLLRWLEGANLTLAAEAARALRHGGDHGDALRRTLLATSSSEVRRSVLIALAELPEPGPAALFLEVLDRSTSSRVRAALHHQVVRSGEVDGVRAALERVTGAADYQPYAWQAAYRTDALGEPVQALLRDDAAVRLGATEPRLRQSAARILMALGPAGHREALRLVADNDPVDWVRQAASEALAAPAEP